MRQRQFDRASLADLLFRALDGSDDLVIALERTGDDAGGAVIAAMNDAFCEVSGYDSAELIGRPLLALARPEANPQTSRDFLTAVRDRKSFRSELPLNRRDGTCLWLGLHLMPESVVAPDHFVILGRDITESLQIRQQQAAIQGLLAKVFLCVQTPVAIIDEHGSILMTNPAFDRMLPAPAGSLVGKRATDLVVPSRRAAVLAARQRQVETGEDYAVETALQRTDGAEIPVEVCSVTVERADLKRFRIVTVKQLTPADSARLTVKVAGKIKLIGLEEVKNALGDRWHAVAARAMASAEHVIRRRCGPHDTLSRTTDGSFVICFSDLSEDEAAFRAATIAREIRKRLIGEGELPVTAEVSAIAATIELPATSFASPDLLAVSIGERLNAKLAEIEARARATLRTIARSTSCELEPVHGRRGGEVLGQFAKLPQTLERSLQCALLALPPPEARGFDFDQLMLGGAAEQIVAQIAHGQRRPVFLNVDFEVLLDRPRTERYIATCQALDPRLRQRLVLVLTQLPHDAARSRVTDCVVRLRPFCHGVGFQTDGLRLPPIEPSLLSGSVIVVTADNIRLGDANDMTKLRKLIDIAHAHHARVLTRHVAGPDVERRLFSLGMDLTSLAAATASRPPAMRPVQ